MAGEKKGKVYEAVMFVVLNKLQSSGLVSGNVYWNNKPTEMTIEPDFTIGRTPDEPNILFLVTHSGAAGNSHMKYWRNIGELVEAKTRLKSETRVYNIVFDAVIKKDIKTLQEVAFDGQLVIGEKDYGIRLQKWIAQNSKKFSSDAKQNAKLIESSLVSGVDSDISIIISALQTDIEETLHLSRPELDRLWAVDRTRVADAAPLEKRTYLRRGIGKLLMLPPPFSTAIKKNGRLKDGLPTAVIRSLETLKLIRPTLGGMIVTDPELLWPIINLESGLLEQVCELQPRTKMMEWIEPLQTLGSVPAQVNYITNHWSELVSTSTLYQHLIKCHLDPSGVDPKNIPSTSKRVWLFHDLMEWIKLAGKTRTGYGLARLIGDLEELSKDPEHRTVVADIVKAPIEWRAGTTVGLGLTDWHSTSSKQKFPLYPEDLVRVCDTLVRRLRDCPQPNPEKDTLAMIDAIVQSNLETKLLPYRAFQPIEALLTIALSSAGVTFERMQYLESCFAQLARSQGNTIDPRSGGTTVIRARNVLINWQSAHEGHTNDKKKELCGRAVALRYEWDTMKKRFKARLGIERLILIVDGTWKQADLTALVRAGWDNVYYPDDIDDLISSLK